MKHKSFLLLAFLFYTFCIKAQINIIPKPNEIKITDGKCSLKKGINLKIIRGDEPTKLIQKQATEFLKQRKIPISTTATTNLSINLLATKIGDSSIADAYTLSITANNILLVSQTNAGLFYGLQSLYQLLKADSLNVIPCVEIKDQPSYYFRGFQLDVCQNFFNVDVVKSYIDAISKLKLNQFIWKLADETTWRIKTKSNIGFLNTDSSETEFYTHDEIKQVIQYANDRFVNVIPEINFAKITALEETLENKKNILEELFNLFPSLYFNVNDPIYINDDLEAYLKTTGKKIISKDITFSKNDIVWSFKNTSIGTKAASKGYDVIMAPRNLCSLDNYQDWDDSKLSKSMLFLPLYKVYKFDASTKTPKHIIGSQANVDTRFIYTESILSEQVYPRIFALAEIFWTNKNNRKSFKDFSERLEKIGYPGQLTEKINMVKFK